jgi:hypothetical protein
VLIHNDFERAAAAPRFGLKPGGNILIKGQGSSHIMMLHARHHDV